MLFIVFVLTGVAVAQPSEASSTDLAQYRWQNRLILLFAPSPEDARYQEQATLLEEAGAGLQDRDLIIFHLLGGTGYLNKAGSADEQNLTQNEVEALRERFGVGENGFALLLVGKDGTVKRRAEEVVSVDDLFNQIDAMPMRRREMDVP